MLYLRDVVLYIRNVFTKFQLDIMVLFSNCYVEISTCNAFIVLLCIIYEMFYYTIGAFLFVCFVALRPKSTAIVIAGRSVHLTTLFPGQA